MTRHIFTTKFYNSNYQAWHGSLILGSSQFFGNNLATPKILRKNHLSIFYQAYESDKLCIKARSNLSYYGTFSL